MYSGPRLGLGVNAFNLKENVTFSPHKIIAQLWKKNLLHNCIFRYLIMNKYDEVE